MPAQLGPPLIRLLGGGCFSLGGVHAQPVLRSSDSIGGGPHRGDDKGETECSPRMLKVRWEGMRGEI